MGQVLWNDLSSGAQGVLPGRTASFERLAVSPDGCWLVSGDPTTIRVFDLREVGPGKSPPPIATAPVTPFRRRMFGVEFEEPSLESLLIDTGAARVLFAGGGENLQTLDLRTGRTAELLKCPQGAAFSSLGLTKDRTHLVTELKLNAQAAHHRGPFQIWDYRKLCAEAGLEW